MFGFESLRDALMGERPSLPAPVADDPEHAAAILAQLEETTPTLERGKAWLARARNHTPFLTQHQGELLSAVPALRTGATNSWISLMKEHWDPSLESDELVGLLAAMLAWEVAASTRALLRLDIEAHDLPSLIWEPMVQAATQYLIEQTASDAVLQSVAKSAEEVGPMIDLGIAAPEAGDPAPELINATVRWCDMEDQEIASEALAGAWRIMDVAAIGMLYRTFGEGLQRQSVR